MNALDKKLNDYFTGYVVRKDLVKQVSSNAAVPGYVLEYLLGQNCATDDEDAIAEGVERVKDILAQHYVERAQANAIQSDIKLRGYMRVIDKVTVVLNEKRDAYEATFENLRISHVLVDSDTVRQNRRLLVSGVWCICDLSYSPNEAKNESSFLLNRLKPIQMAHFFLDGYQMGREAFTTEEWVDVMVRSTGLDPEQLGRRSKLFMLTRLIPYCERNYNLVELGPKGTGKSHVFSELSPHGILISGGDVTPAKLFVNNSNGRIRPISDETALLASGTSYLGDIQSGNIIDFYFYSAIETQADIAIRASSGYLTYGDGWSPKMMSDEQVNRLFDAYANGEKITIDDDVILPGKGDKDNEVDMSLWVNWQTVSFGLMSLQEGWNTISLKITSDYVNYLGYGCSFNLDYLSVNFVE